MIHSVKASDLDKKIQVLNVVGGVAYVTIVLQRYFDYVDILCLQ